MNDIFENEASEPNTFDSESIKAITDGYSKIRNKLRINAKNKKEIKKLNKKLKKFKEEHKLLAQQNRNREEFFRNIVAGTLPKILNAAITAAVPLVINHFFKQPKIRQSSQYYLTDKKD